MPARGLLACLAALTSSPAAASTEDALVDRAVAAWGPAVLDLRGQARGLDAAGRAALDGLVGEYRTEGFDLRIVLVDATGPKFSIGTFTSTLAERGVCGRDCVLLTATPRSLHSDSRWFQYAEVRRIALGMAAAYAEDPVGGLLTFGRRLMEEGRRRARHRRIMVAVAAAALVGMAAVVGRATARRRRRA